MCYAVSYDCVVFCINTDLNTTKLGDGIISGNGYGSGCAISCAEGIRDTGWATTHAVTTDPSISPWGFAIACLMILLVFAGIAFYMNYYANKEKKP